MVLDCLDMGILGWSRAGSSVSPYRVGFQIHMQLLQLVSSRIDEKGTLKAKEFRISPSFRVQYHPYTHSSR